MVPTFFRIAVLADRREQIGSFQEIGFGMPVMRSTISGV